MELSRIKVEVRDSTLARKGLITSKWLDLKATILDNGVGTWTLTLPRVHPLAATLGAPGSGLVISIDGTEWMSGPTVNPTQTFNKDSPSGDYTFEGVSDDCLLADALAYPQPGNSDPATQNVSNDVRTTNAESLMRQYVSLNICNGALVVPTQTWAPAGRLGGLRNKLRLETTNGNRGAVINKSPRFQNLGELLGEIAILSNLSFRVIQRGSQLVFEVVTRYDRSALVQLSVDNGSLASESLQVSPPTITRAIVAGQGEGTDRQILQRTTAASTTAEGAWGRIIEQFIDQRNTNDTTELQQAGDKELLDRGFTATAVKAVPTDDQTMRYLTDWTEGDTVGLVTFGQLTKARVTSAVLVANKDRVAIGAAIGDVSGFSADAAIAARVEDTASRVDSLERSVEISGTIDWTDVTGKPSTFAPSAHSHPQSDITGLAASLTAATTAAAPTGTIHIWPSTSIPTGYLLCNGQAVSRTTYAALFSVLSTAYGTGDGSTTFNVPDMRGRAPMGYDTTNANFNTIGKKGGTETETLTIAQMPAHNHPFGYSGSPTTDFADWGLTAAVPGAGSVSIPQGTPSATNRISIRNAGGGGSHNNLPPYEALQFIIKT